ncbi:glycosyltransferase family 4 protein [Rhodococcus fascians]|jgi:phosphatidylinositol alpha-1,6-mannosyltransferase|uniref:phosphatidyl-myo-inositol dimannoside synthase n=1 Tax=Rhodococcoides fascians TaxID=1828 RepID=A0A143QS41_RHOFA|nr:MULTISPECIES: glycosyltransferase family 4 protein [Rhodococcus]AMY25606.1 GDP-mannose-dependent alpha-(1-6)-phosphatidylinositol monomannoside mannosyltransferase [Rhodococcus fascians]AMY55230.1 GDP-mannose-dependent alpha-(1-6)-phosphatidylinositol monomannoside mannosyltransferase [Rhodococcus fascians D188]KMJ49506.1 GDP-mannose-dependent alpha-(1-6)-phosphatidylinositol monomannoside mannosyltransferase [Rhodococcus fascians]KQU33657.1 alpha-(1-2)-phosphatidylinositol mannosyltransfera
MRRTLLVTNDFPPRPGGIQSYLHSFASQLPADELVVYAPRWRGDSHVKFDAKQPFEVIRHPTTLMLPTPLVARRAARIVKTRGCDSVWFGAAAPLAVMSSHLRKAGADRIVASTHGHEVGWSMVPGGRATLRTIGENTDVVTYVSKYTRSRFSSAFGASAALEHLPPGVDTDRFVPDDAARTELRARYGLGDRPTVLCLSRLVPRKGQDFLIRALPEIRRAVDGAVLVIVGGGPYENTLRELVRSTGMEQHVVFTGTVPSAELAAHHTIADVFAMPSRTRGAGLDVEGLGIVYLEASACGVPVVAGMSGGAPEAVQHNKTGLVVDGTSVSSIADAIVTILSDRTLATQMGNAGRAWVDAEWRWDVLTEKLRSLI